MPYIGAADRQRIDEAIKFLPSMQKPGELNYTITRAVDRFLVDHGFNYTNINAAIGVLECAKQEMYRRLAAPYEDKKLELHGDCYNAKPKE